MTSIELLDGLQTVVSDLQDTLDEVRRLLDRGELSLKDQVEVGHWLWEVSHDLNSTLEPVKDNLRGEAVERLQNSPGTEFLSGHSRGSRCWVTIPEPTVRVRSDASVQRLRELLGDDFDTFFEVVLKARKGFADKAAETPTHLSTLAAAVDTVSSKPRVTFKASPVRKP